MFMAEADGSRVDVFTEERDGCCLRRGIHLSLTRGSHLRPRPHPSVKRVLKWKKANRHSMISLVMPCFKRSVYQV